LADPKGRLVADVSVFDLERPKFGVEDVRKHLPHRYEFEQLSGILDIDVEAKRIVGFTEYAEDAWWARGHIPGYPLLPGVLMIEAAAQLGSWYQLYANPNQDFFWALTGVDNVRFRGTVRPGDTLIIACTMIKVRSRLMRFRFESYRRSGECVCEGEITGMRVSPE
jgi:3-hydroxyacyl-[acyl-carrier-protein] dehydratase